MSPVGILMVNRVRHNRFYLDCIPLIQHDKPRNNRILYSYNLMLQATFNFYKAYYQICVKEKIYFSRTENTSRLDLGIQRQGLKVYQVDSNDDSSLTFDLIMARSHLHFHTLVWGKCKFSENVLKTAGWNFQCMIKVANPSIKIRFFSS